MFKEISEFPEVSNHDEEERFSKILQHFHVQNNSILFLLAKGSPSFPTTIIIIIIITIIIIIVEINILKIMEKKTKKKGYQSYGISMLNITITR